MIDLENLMKMEMEKKKEEVKIPVSKLYPFNNLLTLDLSQYNSKQKFVPSNLEYFQESNLNKIKEDILYSGIPPELLLKVNPSNLKNYLHYVNFYQDFDSENFSDSQNLRNEYLENWIQNINLKNIRGKTITNIFDKENSGNVIQLSNLLLGSITMTIQKFLEKSQKEDLIKSLNSLLNSFQKNENKIKDIKFEMYAAIEENLSILITLIFYKFKNENEERAFYLLKVLSILEYFKSQRILFQILEYLEDEKGDYQQFENIFENINGIDFNSMKEIDFQDTQFNIISQLNEYNLLENKNPKINLVKSANDGKMLFLLINIDNEYYYLKYNIETELPIDLGEMPLKKEENIPIENINFFIKSDLLFVYFSQGNNLHVQILKSNSFTFIKDTIFNLDDSVISIFNDSHKIYCILKGNKLFILKSNLSLNKIEKTEIENYDDNYSMLDNIHINNIFYLTKSNGEIYYSRLIFNNQTNKYKLSLINTNLKLKDLQENKIHNITMDSNTVIILNLNKNLELYVNNQKDRILNFCPYNKMYYNKNYSSNLDEILIQNYARYITLYGNFDYASDYLGEYLLSSPQLFVLNINKMNIGIIKNKLMTLKDKNNKNYLYYWIFLKEASNSIYNTNNTYLKSLFDESIINLMKNFIKEYSVDKNNNKRKILNEFAEISMNIDIELISFKEIEEYFKNNNLTFKDKIYFLNLLSKQNTTKNTFELYKIASSLEAELVSNDYEIYEKIYYDYTNLIKEIFDSFYSFFDENSLFNYFDSFSTNLITICEKIIQNQKFYLSPFISNSFNFKALYFIIQYLLYDLLLHRKESPDPGTDAKSRDEDQKNKFFLLNFYKLLILLDKIQLTDKEQFLDKENIYEVESTHPISKEINSNPIPIQFKNSTDLYVKHNFKNSDKNSSNWEIIQGITSDEKKKTIKLDKQFDFCLKNLNNITFNFNPSKNDDYGSKYQIIPIKDRINFNLKKRNENKKLIELLELSSINYIILSSKKNEKKEDKTEQEYDKIYSSKILENISISDKYKYENFKILPDQFLEVIKQCKDLQKFEDIINAYKNDDNVISTTNEFINLEEDIYIKSFALLNRNLSMKNMVLSGLGGEIVNPLILKLYGVILKFYNLNHQFKQFCKDLNKCEDDINKIRNLNNFNLFYSIWADCSKIRSVFNEQKNLITEANQKDFEELLKKYIQDTIGKADFIYQIIVPIKNGQKQYESSIVAKLIELLKNENFGIEGLKNYSKSQNQKCSEKSNTLSLINSLLFTCSKEKNINLILYNLNKLFRTDGKIVSFSDDLLGVDYLLSDKIKNQFHLFLDIIEDKILNEKFNSYSVLTKINLYQSLIWKIKGRDFSVLYKFKELFKPLLINYEKISISENKFNFNYFDNEKVLDKLFELFQIVSIQVFQKVKPFLKRDLESNLTLERKVSNIGEYDYKKVIEFLINFHLNFPKKNSNFKKLLLLIYKNLINEKDTIIFCLQISYKLFGHFFSLLTFNQGKKEENYYIKYIVSKLIYQCIQICLEENNEVCLESALICLDNENKEKITEDVKEYLFDKIYSFLKEEKSASLKEQYAKILILISTFLEKKDKIKNIVTDNLDNIFPFLQIKFNKIKTGIKFQISNEDQTKNFFNENIYSKNEKKEIIYGRILCFTDNDSLLKSDKNVTFQENDLNRQLYNSNRAKYVYYIPDEAIGIKGSNLISTMEKKDVIISEKDDDLDIIMQTFLKTNHEIIVKDALEKAKGNTNNKKLFIILRLIEKFLPYINEQESIQILPILKQTLEKDTSKNVFTSEEYLLNSFMNVYDNDYEELEKENKTEENNDKELFELLELKIIKSKEGCGIKIIFRDKNKLIPGTLINKEKIEGEEISSSNLCFLDDNKQIEIKENSFVFIQYLNKTENILKILNENKNKIKCLISSSIEIEREEVDYPMLWLKEEKFTSLYNFFNKGIEDSSGLFNIFYNSKLFIAPELTDIETEDDEDSLFGNLFEDKKKSETVQVKNTFKSKELYTKMKKDLINLLINSDTFFYEYLNYKISRRIFISLISYHYLKKGDLNIFTDKSIILTTFRCLCSEYYFNVNEGNISNRDISKLLLEFLRSLSHNDEISIEFLEEYLNFFTNIKINYTIDFKKYLGIFSIKNKKNEETILMDPNSIFFNSVYENYLNLFINNVNMLPVKENLINSLIYIFNSLSKIDVFVFKNNEYISYFLYKLMKTMYNTIIKSKNNMEIYIEFFKKKNLNKFITSMVDKFIVLEGFFESEKSKQKIENYRTYLCQFVFKYFDICLYLLFKYNYKKLAKYWIDSNAQIYIFYQNYQLLATNKEYDKEDIKEILSHIAFSSRALDYINLNNNQKPKSEIKEIIIKRNEMLTFENNNNENLSIKFSSSENSKNQNCKLVLFIQSEKDEKYYLQDIINYNSNSSLKLTENSYYQIIKSKKIKILALKNINTQLFGFGNNYSNCLGINGIIGKDYKEPQKCIGLPKYTWSFNYGALYTLALDEEKKEIYSTGCGIGGGLKSISIKKFSNENKINNCEFFKGKKNIKKFACGNCNSTLILSNDNQVFGVGYNEEYIFGNDREEKTKVPLLLPELNTKEKIVSISIGFKNSFIITDEGKGYALGSNSNFQISPNNNGNRKEWIPIPLPEHMKKFVQCSIGENYFLFLLSDIHNKNRLYSVGNNSQGQCGVGNDLDNVKIITPCSGVNHFEFKKIFTRNSGSAAITINGDLYVFGENTYFCFGSAQNKQNLDYPTLVKFDKDIICDEVALCSTHILVIGREKINDVYVKKLYSCGSNKHFALGYDIKDNKSILNEVEFFANKPELIPIKVKVGQDKSFVLCVNQNEILDNFNNKIDLCDNDENIKISHVEIEDIGEILYSFYNNRKSNDFINLFKSVTRNSLQNFLDASEEIIVNDGNNNKDISYESLIQFLEENQEMRDLCLIFMDKEKKIQNENEMRGIFSFIKKKLNLINSELLKYCSANELSVQKRFLQNAISDNLTYLNAETRMKKFREKLDKMQRYRTRFPTIQIDRFKAIKFYEKKTPDIKFEETVFGQVYQKTKTMKPENYFMDKGGRLFTVALQGEYASDQGGPYHEVISTLCKELSEESLDLFIKSPNNRNDTGALRDKYIINPNATFENHKGVFIFLGRLMASAIATGELLDLNLHPIVWKSLLGNDIKFFEFESVDAFFYKLINDFESLLNKKDTNFFNFESLYDLNFTILNSAGTEVELIKNGKSIKVTFIDLKKYIELSKKIRLDEFSQQIKYLKEGFNSVIPQSVFQVLTWRQLEELVCGKHKLDIPLLKKKTKYEGGYRESDDQIKWFWEWLENSSENNQLLYLKFVWGRTRLPREDVCSYTHIISKIRATGGSFPHSATCFFTLKLPCYDNKEDLFRKMNFAVENCYEIDGDH